ADDFDPSYYDLFGKVQYFLSDKHLISAHILRSYDNMFAKDTEYESLDASYGNTYGWLKWDAQFSSSLLAQTVLSAGRVGKDRSLEGFNTDYTLDFRSSEERGFRFYGLKQDYSFKISNSYLLKWGFDARHLSVDYNFYKMEKTSEELSQNDISEMQFSRDGTEFRSYISNRFRLLNPLTAEIGLRYDYASWTRDKNVSPRVNTAYDLGKKTVIRAGWGKFYQTQKIHQLQIIDGEKTFRPAALSEHYVIGLEHEFDNGIYVRLEAYQKRLSHIHPRYLNFVNIMDISPEMSNDRIKIEPERGEAKGIELYTHGKIRARHSFWINCAYSIVEEIVDGLTVPRNMDQRFTINLDYNYRPNSTWAFNLAWQYHSGWPYTEATLKYEWLPDGRFIVTPFEPGPLNGKRFPVYHRLDVRLRRYFHTSKGRISLFFEVNNLYNRKNIREYDYEFSNITREGYNVEKTSNGWLPIMPTFGISWDF
ncbi:MAG: TonB-dependent receptor plug domain-containing protein, partial [bacterium]